MLDNAPSFLTYYFLSLYKPILPLVFPVLICYDFGESELTSSMPRIDNDWLWFFFHLYLFSILISYRPLYFCVTPLHLFAFPSFIYFVYRYIYVFVNLFLEDFWGEECRVYSIQSPVLYITTTIDYYYSLILCSDLFIHTNHIYLYSVLWDSNIYLYFI